MILKQRILTKNDCYRSGRTITPVCMQLHTIGTAQNSASALADYWNQPGVQACVHYCVDAETEGLVYQFLPDNYRSWADAGVGNNTAITVELMESDYMKYSGGANYTITNETKFKADVTRAYNTAVEFFASKCKEYGWDPEERMSNGLHRVFSHDEGRRAGLSSAHVDPTHIWNRYGWTMDKFRADVKAKMGKVEPEKEVTGLPVSKQDFISKVATIASDLWDTLGILPSVVIAQCCLETGYGLGSDATELVTRNNLLGMKSDLINNTWSSFTVWDGKSFYKRTPEVVGGKTIYINDSFRVYKNYRNCIEDYEQFLRNVQSGGKYKYRQVIGMTDPQEVITAISKGGYATDPSYITKVMSIIKENNLTQYDPKGEVSVMYKVGTAWKDGKCMDQIGAYEKKENALNACALAGMGKYKVFSDGKLVWPTAKTTIPQKAVRWAKAIAADNTHGYNNTAGKRTGNPDYACSSYVAGAYRAAGLTKIPANEYTANMRKDFLAAGFVDVSKSVNLRTGNGMEIGDVVLVPGKHTEMVADAKHNLLGARGEATGGAANGKAGDQSGGEIALAKWWDDGWKYCLRYNGKEEKKAEPTYIVQAGSFQYLDNAEIMLKRVQRVVADAFIVTRCRPGRSPIRRTLRPEWTC